MTEPIHDCRVDCVLYGDHARGVPKERSIDAVDLRQIEASGGSIELISQIRSETNILKAMNSITSQNRRVTNNSRPEIGPADGLEDV